MTFLANENFPFPSIEILRTAGYKVISISEVAPGIADDQVIEHARKENAIILTFDKDYGEIIFKHGKTGGTPSVVFFRFKGNQPQSAGLILLKLLNESKISIEGKFTVLDHDAIRQRAY